MYNLKKYGEWAIITGASSGIGKEFAFKIANEKINLVLVARRFELLKNIKNEIESKNNVQVKIIALDLSMTENLEQLFSELSEIEIGILVNNAGFGFSGDFVNQDFSSIKNMVNLNCVAPALLTNYFANKMIKKNRGAIIFLSSILAFYSTPFSAVYSASKAFNLYIGQALAVELRKNNIDVVAVSPGSTKTDFFKVAKMKGGPFLRNTEKVVHTALKNLNKKSSVVDGLINKVLVLITKFLPRTFTTRLAGEIIKRLNLK